MSALTVAKKNHIVDFAQLCISALVRAEDAVIHGDSDGADAERAIAAYWSGRAFGEVLS